MSNVNRGFWWRDPAEVERLKASADLVGMIRAHGVVLKAEGADLVGLCPFHREETPSFRVTPSKNLWHCFGCNKGGSAVDWLVASRSVSLREAFEALRVATGVVEYNETRAPELVETVFAADPTWSDGRLLGAVTDYYAERLRQSPSSQEFLTRRGLWDAALVDRFRLGVSDRSLGPALEKHPAGAVLRNRLVSLGVFRENGREHLRGCLVVPVLAEPDSNGVCETLGMYGRKAGHDYRPDTPIHLYLKGAHRGVFNASGVLASKCGTVVLCEALLDALTLIRWGIAPVTSAYGVHGVTPELWQFLTTSSFHRVVIAFDPDAAGDQAASELAPRLVAEGLEVQRMSLPVDQDVNELSCSSTSPAEALRRALQNAAWQSERLYEDGSDWLSAFPPPAAPVSAPLLIPVSSRTVVKQKPSFSLAVNPPAVVPPLAVPPVVAAATASKLVSAEREGLPFRPDPLPPMVVPPAQTPAPVSTASAFSEVELSVLDGESGVFETTLGDRTWRVKGLYRNRSDESLRVTLRASRKVEDRLRFHLDMLDLYQAKSREGFVRAAAAELGMDGDVLRVDLARLVVALEDRLCAQLASRAPAPAPLRVLTAEESEAALALLRRPDMLRQLLSDLEASGMVGEEENKQLCWLALTSRHLDSPLGVLIQSSSAAGKTSLLDGVLRTMPEEAVVRYSAMSGQALFYMGGVSLKHKILCVAEEEGARRASYSLKLLQSDGELSMASTGKDPESGQLVTREYRTEGPVALAMTTTNLDVDPELQNRCLVLSVDESREQTQAIHARQRQGETREGLVHRRGISERLIVWRNAQRLLQPVDVVNPFAQDLTFASHRTRTRRDMAKYLTLVKSVALAHQYQKERHADEHGEYIEVSLDDIELANRLAVTGLGMGLRELSGPTERLLRTLRVWVRARAEKQGVEPGLVRFTRRDLSDCTPWSNSQLKEHLRTLLEHEFLAVVRGKNGLPSSVQYQLCALEDDSAPVTVGTMSLERLRTAHPEAVYHGIWADEATRPEPGRYLAGSQNRPGPVIQGNGHQPSNHADFTETGIVAKGRKGNPAGSAGNSRIRRKNAESSIVRTDPVTVAPASEDAA